MTSSHKMESNNSRSKSLFESRSEDLNKVVDEKKPKFKNNSGRPGERKKTLLGHSRNSIQTKNNQRENFSGDARNPFQHSMVNKMSGSRNSSRHRLPPSHSSARISHSKFGIQQMWRDVSACESEKSDDIQSPICDQNPKYDKLSISYLKMLLSRNDDQIIYHLKKCYNEFVTLFSSRIECKSLTTIFEFVFKICSFNNNLSKQSLLDVILSSNEFVASIDYFIEIIIEFSKTDSEITKNLNILIKFFSKVLDYIPKSQYNNYICLMSKAIETSRDASALSRESVENLNTSKNILSAKVEMNNENAIKYKDLSVFPEYHEIFYDNELSVINITKGSYNDVCQYIDTQFRLLKEDFVSGVRIGMKQYLDEIKTRKKYKNHEIFIYKNVEYNGISSDDNPTKKIMHVFKLNSKPLQKVNWETSKRLIHGSLLFFSNDNFQTVFLGVLDDQIKCTGEFSISVILIGNISKVKKYSSYVMIESRVFFEPYYQVCTSLKEIQPQQFPMSKYIVNVDTNHRPPKYLKAGSSYVIGGYEVALNNLELWPAPEKIGLNKSQITALHAALNRELVLIQGPPGTGKTYIGIKLINILLDNKDRWSAGKSPIFVACYRNGAVDQILDSVASGKLGEAKRVVRLGNRSGSELLKNCTLKNTVGHRRDPIMFLDLQNLKEELSAIKQSINDLEKSKTFVHDKQGILNYKIFAKILTEKQRLFFSSSNAYENWLLEYDDYYMFPDKIENMIFNLFEEAEFTKKGKKNISDDHYFVFISVHGLVLELKNIEYILEPLFDRQNQMNMDEMSQFIDVLVLYNKKLNMLRKVLYRLHMTKTTEDVQQLMSTNLQLLNMNQRWAMYHYWAEEFIKASEIQIQSLIVAYEQKHIDFLYKRDLEDGENLRAAGVDVIGATTTGAARLHKLLSAIKPKIVIIEEAAEVLEAHAITSLTEHCEQLILIGDHKQLKPNPASYVSSNKYHMDVSLFERMIINGMECFSLLEQHRMRPEISALVSPYFYKDLIDHPSVTEYPDVKGLKKNLFFLDHSISEDQLSDSDSHRNSYEAEFALLLANYIIQQGYKTEQVTVLTCYIEQLLYLKNIKNKYPLLNEVAVQVVDNFQGEENDIIILSLVRSNSETIGFLAKENRVCVALSRAKQGFFMIGNMENLRKNSKVWKEVYNVLSDASSIDKCLPLKCQTHKKITKVNLAEDFVPLINGGCSEECGIKLECGHVCNYICHPLDIDHAKIFLCDKPCPRKRNCNIHDCLSKCGFECPPCDIKIPSTLPCGHEGYRLCGGDLLQCQTSCTTVLSCGHSCPKKCHYLDNNHSKVVCTAVCNKINDTCPFYHKCLKKCVEECGQCTIDSIHTLQCGHIVKGICFEISSKKCYVKVEKELLCGHVVETECHLPLSEISCTTMKSVDLDCSHTVEALCGKDKSDIQCDTKVEKRLPCGHMKETLCSQVITDDEFCNEVVTKTLTCGHIFENAPCSSSTDELYCEYKVTAILDCGHDIVVDCGDKNPKCTYRIEVKEACGHVRKAPCFEAAGIKTSPESSMSCRKSCNEVLPCSHICKGTCGFCMQGRVHIACNEVCNKLLICGHKCSVKCWNDYHSCQNCKCVNACEHTKCNHACGEKCVEKCMEQCSWSCMHYKCTKKCWEDCNRPQCLEPCPLYLPCKHPCFGLCGEPCPPVCLECSPQKEMDVTDRFLVLDCNHCVSLKTLSTLAQETVGLLRCPQCKMPIVMTRFFRAATKSFFSRYPEVMKSGSRFYDNKNLIMNDFHNNIQILGEVLKKKYEGLNSLNQLLQNLLVETKPFMQGKKIHKSKLALKNLLFVCFFIKDSLEITKIEMPVKINAKILARINHLSSYLLKRVKIIKLSPQEMHHFSLELTRLKCIVDLIILREEESSPGELELQCFEETMNLVSSMETFTEKKRIKASELLTSLKKMTLSNHQLLTSEHNSSDKIVEYLKKYFPLYYHSNNWLKCKEGHSFYSIETFESACPVCCNSVKNTFYFV